MAVVSYLPLVSVVTPTFNRSRFVCEAIESVLSQSYSRLELHVVDDGSTDDTQRSVERFAEDPRFHYHYQGNRGQAAARNLGLRHAQGDLICFLDSDDRWKPHKLARQVELMAEHPEVGIVYGNNEMIDANGRVIGIERRDHYSGWIMDRLLVDNCVGFSTAMVRRACFEVLGGLDESIPVADDYELWLRFSVRFQFLHANEIVTQYRKMDEQISSNKDRRFTSNLAVLERFMAENPGVVSRSKQRYVWCRFFTRRGRQRASEGRLREAVQDYLAALRYQPLSRHPWRAMARLALLRS